MLLCFITLILGNRYSPGVIPLQGTWGGRILTLHIKGGPEPSNFEDLCLVNVSVKYFSKLCSGTIKIQPELKYLKTILEVFTSLFQLAKAWEHEFGRVTSISFIFTGSKIARICKGIYYKYFEQAPRQASSMVRGSAPSSTGSWVHFQSGLLCYDINVKHLHAFNQAKPIILEKIVMQA